MEHYKVKQVFAFIPLVEQYAVHIPLVEQYAVHIPLVEQYAVQIKALENFNERAMIVYYTNELLQTKTGLKSITIAVWVIIYVLRGLRVCILS